MTKIVLADDHTVIRQGLRALLEAEEGFTVIGEASDGLEALQLVEQREPDVLIVDVMMPGLGGLEVVDQVGKRSPKTRAIVLSMYADEAYVLKALKNGAAGYVLKDADADDLVKAVRRVMAGGRYLSPPLSERAIEAYTQRTEDGAFRVYDTLTAREKEVLHLAAEGLTSAQIAERLSISPRTVEAHRTNMMHKLDLHSQTDLIRYALTHGILPMDG